MIRTVKIDIVVDLENPEVKKWANSTDFFEEEVTEVLEKVRPFAQRGYSKYQSEKGTTEAGSKFELVVSKRKKKNSDQ